MHVKYDHNLPSLESFTIFAHCSTEQVWISFRIKGVAQSLEEYGKTRFVRICFGEFPIKIEPIKPVSLKEFYDGADESCDLGATRHQLRVIISFVIGVRPASRADQCLQIGILFFKLKNFEYPLRFISDQESNT